MTKRIAVFGGSFNPPGLHHRHLAAELTRHFDEVIIVPCGPRPDKPTTNDVDPVHRAIMNDTAFRGIDRVRLELFDLEHMTFTRTHELDELFSREGEVWHVVGSDLVRGGRDGESFVHRVWDNGAELWGRLRFAVVPRRGFEHEPGDLPPNSVVVPVEADLDGSGFLVREKAFRREKLDGLVTPEVASYIDRYRLYRGTVVGRAANWTFEPRLKIFYDQRNPKATEIAKAYERFESDAPNCIMAVGGDGTMLQAIRSHWRDRLPFFGVNAGHLGFLLNAREQVPEGVVPEDGLLLRHMPLLYVETTGVDGETRTDLAFNDTWVERAGSQTAWVELKINGQVRIPKLVADGVLLATAAGSTAYARSMGASPLLADSPAMVLVGSNVMMPPGFRSALLSLDAEVEWTSLGGEKRPLNAYVDGIFQGQVQSMRARASRIAAVEIAFLPSHDMAEKIAQIQFPQWGMLF
jgi:NAD kinase/nicotinic acid mononucleotide adenylyltransferase